MRTFPAQAVLVLALWAAGLGLGQEIPVTDVVESGEAPLTDALPESTTTLVEGPEPEPTEPIQDDTTQTDPVDEGPSTTEVVEIPTDIPTDIEVSETTPSDTAVADASTTEDVSETETAVETPAASSDVDSENRIVLVEDPSQLTNSTEDFEPVQVTPETWKAEEEAIKTTVEISEDDAEQIAIFEGHYFNDFVENAPASGDKETITIPTNASECEPTFDKRASRLRKRIWPFGNRKPPCIAVYHMEVPIHYNYILPTRFGDVPKNLVERIAQNHLLMNKAYEAFGITFDYGSFRYWYPPAEGFNKNWESVTMNEDRLLAWQRQSHQGDKMSLNVWIVNDLGFPPNADGSIDPVLGYGSYPWAIQAKGKADGIVITHRVFGQLVQDASALGSTLIHEAGHWLGLRHTFGSTTTDPAQDCLSGDGLLGTTHTRGLESVVFNCKQVPCVGTQEITVDNWMSYSECPGSADGKLGFSTDQKAAMYARTVYWRRGLRRAECNPTDPGTGSSKVKRSTMQDLVDGNCPDVDAAVDEILETDAELLGDGSNGDNGDGSGSGSGGGGDDEDDGAAGLRIVPLMLWAMAGVASFLMLM